MFWRFGFANASSIDSLLDKDEVSLEAILDEDDLLQECKAQNTRLIDYFQRVDVLQRLFGYVTRTIETEQERGVFKYPYVATEVLCSEIWSIVETTLNEQQTLLLPFWETVLDRSAEDMKTEMVLASHFAKISTTFLSKKPKEMLEFIKTQPNIIDKLLVHLECPSIVDLLVRIMELDETDIDALDWLSSQDFIPKLLDLLSPRHSSDLHIVVADLIKTVISMATPSPSAGSDISASPSSNLFARQLAYRSSIEKLMTYILADFGPNHNVRDPEEDEDEVGLPTLENSTSSVVQSISIIIELIRKNNSDFFEPYLFHMLRQRLIQVRQTTIGSEEETRAAMEKSMDDLVGRIGVVHLGPTLDLMTEALSTLQNYLKVPRSLTGPFNTTIGAITPLTFERYRIVELFAELLHCSNMSLLNRQPAYEKLYDAEGRLQGGLEGLEDLAQVVTESSAVRASGEELAMGGEGEDDEDDEDGLEPAMELPVSSKKPRPPSMNMDSDEEDASMGTSSDGSDEEMEEIMQQEDDLSLDSTGTPPPESPSAEAPTSPTRSLIIPDAPVSFPDNLLSTSPVSSSLAPPGRVGSPGPSATSPRRRTKSNASKRSSRVLTSSGLSLNGSSSAILQPPAEPVGEKLKKKLIEIKVLGTLLDLFFEYPWNNFLHIAVYDVIHQILTGSVEKGCANRALAIALFKEEHLMQRIVDGQKKNNEEVTKPKGVRLGYMGHLTLISEDVLMVLDRFPPDLAAIIRECAPQPDWDDYVNGHYEETKRRDESLLGGGKPVIGSTTKAPTPKWKVEEEQASKAGEEKPEEGIQGVFRRSTTGKRTREGSADFGVAMVPEDDEEEKQDETGTSPKFAQYLASQMGSSQVHLSSSTDDSDSDDDDDDQPGWLSQSSFTPSTSLPAAPGRRPLAGHDDAFNDSFDPESSQTLTIASDPFSDDDDAFGAFTTSSSSASDSNTTDPFGFSSTTSSSSSSSSSFSPDDMMVEDSSFDFGDFQTAEEGTRDIDDDDDGDGDEEGDGQLTPTAGSWTFSDDFGFGPPPTALSPKESGDEAGS